MFRFPSSTARPTPLRSSLSSSRWFGITPSPRQRFPLQTPIDPGSRQGYKRFGQGPNGRTTSGRKYLWGFVAGAGGLFYVTHLEKVEMTGRRRFMAISPEAEAEIAKQSYQAVMQEYGNNILPASDPRTKLVMRVMKRIIAVSGMTDLNWEVHVIESPEKNAFVSPGGKVFVFTGILPIAKNEDGLAVVLGHETAHQIARHTAEKLSLGVIISALRFAVFFAGLDIGPLTHSFFQFLMDLPNSRKCESEADHIGLLLTAQACYNPQEAIPLWQRMEAAEAVGVPQFLSTHPTPKNRIQQMQEWMHEAQDKRANSNCTQQLGGWADQFRRTQSYARGF